MAVSVLALVAWSGGVAGDAAADVVSGDLPWRQAGLTERQAAAHLLDRFTFGPRGPEEITAVVEMGLERWLETQLAADLPDRELEARLAELSPWGMTDRELVSTYPGPGRVLAEMRRDGRLDEETMAGMAAGNAAEMEPGERREMRQALRDYAREKGYRPQRELLEAVAASKLLRAVESGNQLREVLTDFWVNHFHVSAQDGEARPLILAYERDAIRPHVLEGFRKLLGATARHPAMLVYLDNARSVADEGRRTTLDVRRAEMTARRGTGTGGVGRGGRGGPGRPSMGRGPGAGAAPNGQGRNRPRGLNENYARELLELHTLGVDGGYTQDDVVEVARAFTGWAVVPPARLGQMEQARQGRQRLARARQAGFVLDPDSLFVFRADAHDAEAKIVLGTRLPAGGGIEDGERVLDLLATHPATARHLARKLAVRFVADQPPEALVEELAAVLGKTGGGLTATMRALAYSPHFWSADARGAKIKSPFELAVSALRALDAEIASPRGLAGWLDRMGQPLYGYPAPTGYPDSAGFWVNTGALLQRMSFGLALADGRVPGVRWRMEPLLGEREPASREQALERLLPRLLPERYVEATARRLRPLLHDPELATKVAERADAVPVKAAGAPVDEPTDAQGTDPLDPDALEQVVGLILGSPEFQRR